MDESSKIICFSECHPWREEMSKSDVSFVNGYLLKDQFAFSSLCYNEIGTICYDKNQIFSTHKKVINF